MFSNRRIFSRRGLSLVELMIATAVAAVLMAVTFSLYQVVNGSMEDSIQHRQGLDSAVKALNVLSRDVRCAFIPDDGTNTVFEIIPPDAEGESTELRFFTRIPNDEGEGLYDSGSYQIHYLITEKGLERRLFVDDEVMRQDVIAPYVVQLLVEAGNASDSMVGVWPPAPELKGPPPLLHLILFYLDPKTGKPQSIDTHVAVAVAIKVDPETATDEGGEEGEDDDGALKPPLP